MSLKLTLLSSALALTLSACGDSGGSNSSSVAMVPDPDPVPVVMTYEVTVTNLTKAQPLSPLTVVLHNEGNLWAVGEMASGALEVLAESGDNSDILALSVVLANGTFNDILMPGMTETVSVSVTDMQADYLSLATMLVNTNDAFAGVNAFAVNDLAVGESISMQSGSYDAGTEKNSELMATIPGPAGGGEGYNAERDDVDFVAMHPGVVSSDDGLMQSALSAMHKFDNPTLNITITRTE